MKQYVCGGISIGASALTVVTTLIGNSEAAFVFITMAVLHAILSLAFSAQEAKP